MVKIFFSLYFIKHNIKIILVKHFRVGEGVDVVTLTGIYNSTEDDLNGFKWTILYH